MKTKINVPAIGGYYGGKASMVAKILPHFPRLYCRTLVSPFAGFASLELATDTDHLVLADINPATVAALKAIRDNPEWLIESLMDAPWGRDFFASIKRDRCNLAIAAIAFSAMAHHRGGSLSGFSQQQCDRAARRDWSHLLRVSERLQGARIRCQDFRKSFAQAVTDSMIYLDPPYLDGGQYYQHTMSEQDHHDMLTLAKRHDGPVAISGYDSELYLEQLHGWRRVEFVSQNAQREKRTEVLWMNYP